MGTNDNTMLPLGTQVNVSDNSEFFPPGTLVSTYTRAQAIAEGELMDVTEVAREARFTVPVALTRAVWADCVAWSVEDNKRKHIANDEAGRLWDVVWMAFNAARRAAVANRCSFEVFRVPREGRGSRPRRVLLALHIGPGDAGEPVITILQPNED